MLYKNIDVDGLNIFYREAGKEGAPKLVLLHGFPELCSCLTGPFSPQLTDRALSEGYSAKSTSHR